MPDGSAPLLAALIILVILSGFFSATETAYSCVNRIKLRANVNSGNKRAAKVLSLSEEKFDKLISTILVGNNIVNLSAATVSALFFAKIITQKAVDSSLISTAVITVAVLIFGEITPKFIAKTYPEKTAMLFYPLVKLFYVILYPFNVIFSGWKLFLSKAFRLKRDDVITEEEIMTVVEEAEEDGTLKKEETRLIRSAIEFDDLEVGDILIPRVNVIAAEVDSDIEDIRKLFENEGYSRMPVYSKSIDSVIGIIHEKDLYSAYLKGEKSIKDIMQKPFYTTEHVKISRLLKLLQKRKTHMAVVLDEYGGTAGIVTLEDILEELVGEIWDEHDEEINFIHRVSENAFTVDGDAPVSEVFEKFGLSDKTEEYEAITFGGFITEYLGEIPRAGKSFDFEKINIKILKSTVKRIQSAQITVLKNDNE